MAEEISLREFDNTNVDEISSNEEKKEKGTRHKIEIHGLISHPGTLRAKLCIKYLRKYLKHVYEKPIIKVYYDVDWVGFLTKIRTELSDKFPKLYYLKNPVIVFLDDRFIGDHRALIQHITYQHGIIPDLPFPDIFPDFTTFLPKNRKKSYVFLDLRIGDVDDYLVGKLVFELHRDVAPKTCEFFSNLCEPFGREEFSSVEKKTKLSYLGSTVRRVCPGSFIQGGVIPNTDLFRILDENFTIPHDRRGVLSLANQGGNRSTTEFVISLKENPWMNGTNVAFGQLVFGNALLEAIEEIPTYYQSPLKDIFIVGSGVIKDLSLHQHLHYEDMLSRLKVSNKQSFFETKKKKLEEMCLFENKLMDSLKQRGAERAFEFFYTGLPGSPPDEIWHPNIGKWPEEIEDEGLEKVSELFSEENKPEEETEVQLEESLEEENLSEPYFKEIERMSSDLKDLTLKEVYRKAKKKDTKLKTDMITQILNLVLEKTLNLIKLKEDPSILEDTKVLETKDWIDIRDVPSGYLNEEFYNKGLYSLPKSLRKTLIKCFDSLSAETLKLLGIEARGILRKSGLPEGSLQFFSSEDLISGLFMAIINVKSSEEESLEQEESVATLVQEICEDIVPALRNKGSNFLLERFIDRSFEVQEEESFEASELHSEKNYFKESYDKKDIAFDLEEEINDYEMFQPEHTLEEEENGG